MINPNNLSMSAFWKKMVLQIFFKKELTKKGFSPYKAAKKYRELTIIGKRNAKDFVLISVGILSAAFGFKGFLLTNHFIDGGATGISLLVSAMTKIPLYWLVIAINIPFIFLANKVIGKILQLKPLWQFVDWQSVWLRYTFQMSQMTIYWLQFLAVFFLVQELD